MEKTRIAYYIMVRQGNHILHQQYIYPNELHLISTFFKDQKDKATDIVVERHELSADHWLFT